MVYQLLISQNMLVHTIDRKPQVETSQANDTVFDSPIKADVLHKPLITSSAQHRILCFPHAAYKDTLNHSPVKQFVLPKEPYASQLSL
ncbi:neuroligin 4 [Plakobranchus ocellatus]|uniref:Neuroligin 4 n=1 Tax=Plakobranchus ocellatus TaxID=259542 RepID=A0AAV3XVG2_9GAST|nr:neuroligin 4 [Plakobranchus ocellatus]